MRKIDLELAPAAEIEEVARSGSTATYAATGDDPQIDIRHLPADLAFGLYKLAIRTPDAAEILDSSTVLAGDERIAVRATYVRRPDGLDAYVVLPENCRSLRFAPVLLSPRLRIGPASLERVSTSLYRARRVSTALMRRLASPSGIWRNLSVMGTVYRHHGIAGVRHKINEAIYTPNLVAAQDLEMRFGRFAGRVAARNGAILAAAGTDGSGSAAALSIVVPVYRTPEAWLLRLLDSLNGQSDQDFELVMVFDGPQPETQAFAEANLAGSYRRRMVALAVNGGVSVATNAGIRTAEGDYVVVVDHDDVLESRFVEAFHHATRAAPADIYFADEAITDGEMNVVRSVATRGKFDIRFYLSHPYIVHPIFIRRDLALAAGLLDERLRVSHDVEFFLRCIARARTVVQIPLLLYYWRTHEGSLGHAQMDRVSTNTKAAVRAFLAATTDWTEFEVRDGINFNEYDIRPPVPDGVRVAVIIPTKNRMRILSACLSSLHARKDRNRAAADIFVVDHQSDDPETIRYLAAERDAGRIGVVAHAGPWNYAAINNAAVGEILRRGDYTHLVFMNNDIELVTEDWLDRMTAQFSYGDVGVVGCCLEYPDGRVQHGGVVIGLVGVAEHSHKFDPMVNTKTGRRFPGHLCSLVATRDYSAVTAATMIVPTALFRAVGGFDENLAVGFNDTDLCLRIGALGFRSTYVGQVVAIHHESVSRGDADSNPHPEDTRLFQERYDDIIRGGDEYYGLMMDWSSSRARVSLKEQKSFRLRETRLHKVRAASGEPARPA